MGRLGSKPFSDSSSTSEASLCHAITSTERRVGVGSAQLLKHLPRVRRTDSAAGELGVQPVDDDMELSTLVRDLMLEGMQLLQRVTELLVGQVR